jgi:hypothetical protein
MILPNLLVYVVPRMAWIRSLTARIEPGPSNSLYLFLGEWPRLPFTARIERYKCSLQACSFYPQGWGLIDLPLRASNEGSPRPRVARAQKIIRLHPFLCSASKKGTWMLPARLADFFSILQESLVA